MWKQSLFKRIDNSPLIVFRIIFGFLLACECWGAIMTGWVKRTLIEPQFTFNFIGFDFLQPLPGNGMYFYFGIMGLLGIFVMIGYKYRWSMGLFTIMWTSVYLMQKSSYNNHYYLLVLICVFMLIVPAHRYFSVDVRRNPSLKSRSMPRWVSLFIIFQLFIVYTCAAMAKFYPDWLNGTVPAMLMRGKSHFWLIGDLLQQDWAQQIILYFGILFDLLFVPLLLWKRTRTTVFIFAVFFHLFNSFVLHIGIFPYLSLAFCLFFFPTQVVQTRFLPQKTYYDQAEVVVPSSHNLLLSFFAIWFVIQIGLPVRHWFIDSEVLWTEEGHRLSWRMMLRSRSGATTFRVVNKATGDVNIVVKSKYLTHKQMGTVSSKPDAIWQFCQRLRREQEAKGEEVEIFVRSMVSVNGHPSHLLIDPDVDMAHAKWNYFFHNDWILPSKLEEKIN